MVTDQQRGRYGRWLRKERLARGWSVDETRQRLSRAGYRIGESSYAEWESGRKRPSRDALPHLVELFGSEPPEEPTAAVEASSDMAALIAAMREQTEVNRQMAEAVASLALALHRTRSEAPEWFLERGDEWTEQVLRTIRLAVGDGVLDAPSPRAPARSGNNPDAPAKRASRS